MASQAGTLEQVSPAFALAHIFRFENGRIAELWDIAQPAPSDSPNQNGMF
jgi:predicted SnoaL-like aldol condensation-catalyzing enzyme